MAHRRETIGPEAHSHEKQGWEWNPDPSGSACCVLRTTSLECLPQTYFSWIHVLSGWLDKRRPLFQGLGLKPHSLLFIPAPNSLTHAIVISRKSLVLHSSAVSFVNRILILPGSVFTFFLYTFFQNRIWGNLCNKDPGNLPIRAWL